MCLSFFILQSTGEVNQIDPKTCSSDSQVGIVLPPDSSKDAQATEVPKALAIVKPEDVRSFKKPNIGIKSTS